MGNSRLGLGVHPAMYDTLVAFSFVHLLFESMENLPLAADGSDRHASFVKQCLVELASGHFLRDSADNGQIK